jgi:N-acetylglutamate synthase/N-acetylornithine aminotransferase
VLVTVTGARTPGDAERAARRIANSMLVKTAIFGGDANWGRILQTVGAGQVALRLARTSVRLGGVVVFRDGASRVRAARAARARARGRGAEDRGRPRPRPRRRADLHLRPHLRLREDQRRVTT